MEKPKDVWNKFIGPKPQKPASQRPKIYSPTSRPNDYNHLISIFKPSKPILFIARD
jgi:hypothetical protein